MSAVGALEVLDVERELGVKTSTKNPNAGFVDMRDWYAFLPRIAEARAAVAELVAAARMPSAQIVSGFDGPDWVEVSIDDWRALRAALARVGGAP